MVLFNYELTIDWEEDSLKRKFFTGSIMLIEYSKAFYFFGLFFCYFVYEMDISYLFYTKELIIVYSLMTLFVTYVFEQRYNFNKAVSMGFMLVFLNSFYWEIARHFNALFLYGEVINTLKQSTRLIPGAFLFYRFKFENKKKVIKYLLYGVVVSTVSLLLLSATPIFIIRLFHKVFHYWIYIKILNHLNRVICLYILVKIFYEEGELRKLRSWIL